jgi:hypothetical protein
MSASVAMCPITGKPHDWREPFQRKHNKHVNFRLGEDQAVTLFHVYQCKDCMRFKTVKERR